MSKAVLISVRPEWCEKILAGEKTVEVRKTRPRLETPFKAYIYCTLAASKEFKLDDHNWDVSARNHGGWPDKRGHVIAEFTCDRVDTIIHIQSAGCFESAKPCIRDERYFYKPIDDLLQESNLSLQELENYLQGRTGYGLHISNLKVYDTPVELSKFTAFRQNDPIEIKKAPQSWCYIEELHT